MILRYYFFLLKTMCDIFKIRKSNVLYNFGIKCIVLASSRRTSSCLVVLLCRHVARSENLGGRVIRGGQKSGGRAVRAGPKSGGAYAPPPFQHVCYVLHYHQDYVFVSLYIVWWYYMVEWKPLKYQPSKTCWLPVNKIEICYMYSSGSLKTWKWHDFKVQV